MTTTNKTPVANLNGTSFELSIGDRVHCFGIDGYVIGWHGGHVSKRWVIEVVAIDGREMMPFADEITLVAKRVSVGKVSRELTADTAARFAAYATRPAA